IDRTTSQSLADQTFVGQVTALYGTKVITVNNAAELNSTEVQEISHTLQSELRTNSFGVHLSTTGFKEILVIEGVLSFLLIFLGWTFLGSLASEAIKETELSHLAMVIGSGVFVFVFSEVVYVTTSTMLAVPLSLHAVITGAHDITAVGLLGFGGGSTPRLAAGFLGIVLGVVGAEGSPKVNTRDFALISAIILVLLADPFSIGQFAYQGLLLFVGNYNFGGAYASSQAFKGFIYGVGTVFGGSVTPTYLMSAGKMLYFSGLVPFAYLKRMGRTTRVIALLFAAILLGDGGVRVGEMTPDKTVIAILPGIFVGFALLALILTLALIEKYTRGYWRSSG
ncbi:MAG: hypothetical protein OK456_11220, partial [Thaumarchaeota archaeon]|nr:hypothetical protein [Nitrososphaerota archaeon]